MRTGFTGTQDGGTTAQLMTLRRLLSDLGIDEFHHGDCIGADAQAHEVAESLGIRVVVHPPRDHKKRAFCVGSEIRREKPYLTRNRDIVDECDGMIVMPKETVMQMRSGTWSTYRYAKGRAGPIVIIWPNGEEEWR